MKLIPLVLFLLAACNEHGQPVPVTGAIGRFNTERLFQLEGCTVYRFVDGGNHHYFTNCRGSVSDVKNCGKNCERPEEITTTEVPE